MPPWFLPLLVFIVWCLWGIASGFQRAAEDARRGIPKGQRGGVSILPIIPVFPLAFWGIAWMIDRAATPWGTIVIGVGHGVYALCLIISIVRNWRCLRTLDGPA